MHRAGLVRLVRMGLVYLLVAAAAALGWLWHALPEEICLEPGQTLQLPRFAWVEPLRGRGSRNVASTRAVGSYQVTLALGGWLPVRTIRAVVTERPTVTVCGTPFGVKMFSEGALVVGFSDVNTAAGPENPAKAAGLRLGDRIQPHITKHFRVERLSMRGLQLLYQVQRQVQIINGSDRCRRCESGSEKERFSHFQLTTILLEIRSLK